MKNQNVVIVLEGGYNLEKMAGGVLRSIKFI